MKRYTKAERITAFWQRVRKTETCWLWTGNYSGQRQYGGFWDGTRNVYAHRFMWELLNGHRIPKGLTIDHLCNVTRCVNPDHMEVVTQGVNTLRGDSWSGRNSRKTHCPQGHALTPDNVYVFRNGRARRCRTCTLAAVRRRRAA